MTDEDTVPSGTSPPSWPANDNTPDAESAFASAMMASSDSNVAAATDRTYAALAADDPPASDRECANCGSLATLRCTGCDHGVERDGTKSSPTYYCSKDSQCDHWAKAHHHECNLAIDRRQLFRIGRLVQWAFYASTKAMWSDGIVDIEKTEDTEGVQLRVQRHHYQKHDLPDFPSFPESGSNFKAYAGVLEEGDEQAILATSACNGDIVCGLLDELVKACKSRIQVEEVTFHPQHSHRFVSFTPPGDMHFNWGQTDWVFRTTLLRSGSTFAIDPCNAQYTCTTTGERNCGVFKWSWYLFRLSSMFFQFPSGNDIQGFRSHLPRGDVHPVGTIKAAQKNDFVDGDIRSTAESMASSCLTLACATLPIKTTLSLKKLMARNTSDAQHAEHVKIFKAHVPEVIKQGRAKGVKDLLLQRLHHKAGA